MWRNGGLSLYHYTVFHNLYLLKIIYCKTSHNLTHTGSDNHVLSITAGTIQRDVPNSPLFNCKIVNRVAVYNPMTSQLNGCPHFFVLLFYSLHPFKLESRNLDQKCKTHWVFFFQVEYRNRGSRIRGNSVQLESQQLGGFGNRNWGSWNWSDLGQSEYLFQFWVVMIWMCSGAI